MLAAYCRDFNGDALAGLQIGDLPVREAPLGWSRVHIQAAALNGHDLWSLRGVGLHEAELPRILGSDGSGVDEDGREVIIYPVVTDHPLIEATVIDPVTAPLLSERHDGTLAEYVSVPRHCLVPKPSHLSFAEAAALPTAWLTAYRMLFTLAGTRPGDTILVQGATGGVSTALILLGAAGGLRVWVTGRTDAGRATAVMLGASAAFETGQRLPERVDAVMETVGEATWSHSMKCVRPGGTIVVAGATTGAEPSADLRRVFFNQVRIVGARVGTLTEMNKMVDLVKQHGLVPLIDSVTSLAQVGDALARLDRGDVTGKLIVEP